jgi:tRNA nucleotidyltransferase/poly(A) polymerase
MNLPAFVLCAAKLFCEADKELYVVGGAVRDAVLGKTPKDIDLATNATPDEVVGIFQQLSNLKILEVGKSFGVIKVIAENGDEYEIATFRSDVGLGRRPDSVVFTSIDQDVMRRDLTINALFYDLGTGEIVDYVGGLKDMENHLIRTVGEPSARFNEDRLRVLRALRFAARLGYGFAQETAEAIRMDNNLRGVSPERVRDEFLKGIKSAPSPSYFLELIAHFNLWEQVFPNLKVDVRAPGCKDVVVQLAWLLRDNDPKVLVKALNQLKYSAEEVSQVSFLVNLQNLSVETAYRFRKGMDSSHVTLEQVRVYAEQNTRVSPKLVEPFCQYQPSVSGEELVNLGFKGSEIGREMTRLETEKFKMLVG